MPIRPPNPSIVPIPDDLLESKAFATCEYLLLLQEEYGGVPIPLPHPAVMQVLELVRTVAKTDSHLLSVAEAWQVTVFGLHDARHSLIPTPIKTPAARAPPTRRPPQQHPTIPGEPPTRSQPSHSHSLPSYDHATLPCAPCRMKPVTVAPIMDTDQVRSRTPLLVNDAVPVAPEMDEEHYHSFPPSPPEVPPSPLRMLEGMNQSVDEQVLVSAALPNDPLRLPSPVEVSVNVQTSMSGPSSPIVSVQTILGVPSSPHLSPVQDFSVLPVPAMAPNTPNSSFSPMLSPSLMSDHRVTALVAAHLNRARHAAGLPLEPVLFTIPGPNLPRLTSAMVIETLEPAVLDAWVKYYVGPGVGHVCVDVLKACVGLQ